MNRYPTLLLALLILLITQTAAGEWVQETIDLEEGHQFSYPQIVIDAQGTSHVLYHDGTGWGIRYASNDGSGWSTEIVDDVGYLMPVYGLAVAADGTPYVGYRGATTHLEYAIREAGGWASAKIDSSGTVNRISACMGSGGLPMFAYVRDDMVRLARWTGDKYESMEVGAIADCDYLRLRMAPSGEPVIGAVDGDSGTMWVFTGETDFSGWTADSDLVVANLGASYAFDLNDAGSPHWCYFDTSLLKVVISSNVGAGWVDVSLDDTPTFMFDILFDFCFDRQDNPGLVINGHYAHMEGGEWIWRSTDLLYLPFPASLAFHANGNATFVCTNMAYTWWNGQPILVMPESGHVWDDAYVQWDLTLQNTGDMPLVIDDVDYLSGDSAIFPVIDPTINSTYPLVIQPGASGVITFDFQPTADGTYTAEVELSTNDPVSPAPAISLEGTYESTQPGGVLPMLVTNVHADMLNNRLVEDVPLAYAEVSLLQGAVTAYGPLTTAMDGEVRFTGVTPGIYSVKATSDYTDHGNPQTTRRVTSITQNVNIAEGLNPQATVALPDSLMQQAYRATYAIEDLGDSDLMTFAYPSAVAARQVLANLGQDMSSYEKIQSVSRLMLACDASGVMFDDAGLVGDSFVAGLGNISTFLFYSNNWLQSIIDIIKLIAKAVVDKMGAMLDTIILVAKIVLRFVVDGAVQYALGFLPCDDTDLVCVRDVGKAAWNGLNSAFGGFGIGAFSYDEWDYFVEKAELLVTPVFHQYIYIESLTDPDLAGAVERSADLDFASTFDNVAPRTYEDLEENAGFTDSMTEICNDLLTAAQLMYATAVVFDALENIPYLGVLGTVGDIMNITAWLSLGSSLGISGGVYFTQPMFLDDLIDDVYDPDKSTTDPRICAPTGRPLSTKTRTALKSALKAAEADYAAVLGDVGTAVEANDPEEAALALVDLAAADRRWMRQSELARKPVYAVAAQANAAHAEFAAEYDTLLARNTAAGASHLMTYLSVLALSADEKGDMRDFIQQTLTANAAANTAFSEHMGVIMETISDLPLPAILAAADITQSADRLQAGRVDTLTVRLTNLGGADASNIDLVLRTSDNLEVVDTDSLRITTLAGGAESADYMFFVQPVGADTTDALWSLDISASNAESNFESGLFLAPIGGVSPDTGGKLTSDTVYNYPNPFNPEAGATTLRFSLAKAARVSVRIYDSGNRLVRDLLRDASYTAREEVGIDWDGRNGQNEIVANGVYFAVIESNQDERAVVKIAVLR